jgi:pimeloyl-ACP methyl ester carboxylesterase
VYTTGDGGWKRKDLALYRQIVSWGYPIAGFSAPDYLDHLRGEDGTTTPGRLGRDYADIIAFAETNLGLEPGTPVVLVGVSRGAGLEVVAAGQPRVRDKLTGVVAVALTREEEYVRWFGRFPILHRPQERVMVQVYEYLPLLGQLPIAVVQSTHDQFLPAAAAAQLFGAETPTRRFRAIEARNHSFAGARAEMYQACREAFDWILGRDPSQRGF